MRAHARFETLAGALLLSEATSDERAEFEAHARGCGQCRDGPSVDLPLRGLMESAGARETWQPSLAGDVYRRIAESRRRCWRAGLGTLGYAVAASLVLNVAFVTGFAGRALDALRVVPDFRYSATQPITLERRPVAVAPQVAPLGLVHRARRAASVRAMRPQRRGPPQEKIANAGAAGAIQGLAIWDASDAAKRDVAQIERRCESPADTVFASEEPCPLPTESR